MQKILKWEDKVERCESYTEQLIATRIEANVVCAFVTFREEQDKLALLEEYPNSFGRRLFMSRAKRFRGKHRIKVPNQSKILANVQLHAAFSVCIH